ncbi:hypothetical protein OR626_20395 [Pseudomonas sp. S1Bt30]|uniref:Uncharacterized protein n=1 Tax=Pseudomonas quebecensis TaxID=2995174 RepID=A0ABY6QC69_9PSED|nr:hypothetical protein [Pseudomonas quebecensis]MCX4066577.1 hypothetical protein [Pseudomonas quebecensis]UZW16929.1 hypothetical protein OSC50_16205 [Pseudomonas quebecensis]UZW25656.1 hypothetical protein OSC48_09275 [Pseudomonas quebecensis]UZW30719.1 hypothetical protein OSC49_09275 [Pseudomonas quebecensis]
MMLLRTLVLERNGQDAPVNGALLCGFAVTQIASNFLVYSLDEEVEPGSSRVYIAALHKKTERYFLDRIESREHLQIAMQAFKQILMLAAASNNKLEEGTEPQVPYHFVDLKGCKLPPARPEDHHSVIIKKALVMKVITLGISAPALAAIESASLIVPSIRFSSQMVSPPRVASPPDRARQPVVQDPVEAGPAAPDGPPAAVEAQAELCSPQLLEAPDAVPQAAPSVPMERHTLAQVDSTLTNLARVAQDLTQQKLAVVEREAELERWQARLQQEQQQMDEKRRELELLETQQQAQAHAMEQKAEALNLTKSHLSILRQNLQRALQEMDQGLAG